MRLFFLLFILFSSTAFALIIEGGNITNVNVTKEQNSTWFGVCGQASSAPATSFQINATPGGLGCFDINTGSASCTYGVDWLYLIFSNSSTAITDLSRGNLSILDDFIINSEEDATTTLSYSTSFTTTNGTITGVPTTYTLSTIPGSFRMGYLNDQDDNILIISPVVSDLGGFNDSLFDFQFMLPTYNGTETTYYLTVDLKCYKKPSKPPEDECDNDNDCDEDEICKYGNCVKIPCDDQEDCPDDLVCYDGQCREPECEDREDCDEDEVCEFGMCIRKPCDTYFDCPLDMTCKDGECAELECSSDADCDEDEECQYGLCIETEEKEPEEGRPEEIPEVPECVQELVCGEWGSCIDGYRYQSCQDLNECTTEEVILVEECEVEQPEEEEPEGEPEEEEEMPEGGLVVVLSMIDDNCLLVLLVILAILLFLLWKRRKKKNKK